MNKKFYDAIYPAYDGRDTIPQDEVVARAAYHIITEDTDPIGLYSYTSIYGPPPRPNKSARIESRSRVSQNEELVTVRGSEAFFQAVEEWLREGVD